VSTHDDLEREAAERLPHYGSPDLRPVQLAEVYAKLAAVAVGRAEFYGRKLDRAFADEGMDALIGYRMDAAVLRGGKAVVDGDLVDVPDELKMYAVGEELRALVVLEAQERDRAAKLAKDAVQLGLEARRVDVMRSYGKAVAAVTRAFVDELGLDWADPSVRRAAQRAVLASRQSLGFDYRSPETIGPRLSADERTRVLGSERQNEEAS
jgi:hypothetical protein